MPIYAQLAGGVCRAVVQTSGPLVGPDHIELPDYDLSYLGRSWDGSQWGEAPAPAVRRHVTRLAFRNRFTRAEKVAIEIAALDNPAAALAERQMAAALRADLADQRDAAFIDLDRADTRAGVQQLETLGLLGAGRALQILDAEINETERPQ